MDHHLLLPGPTADDMLYKSWTHFYKEETLKTTTNDNNVLSFQTWLVILNLKYNNLVLQQELVLIDFV